MIKVYGGMGAWGVPDVSPPCLKLRTYIKMAKIESEDQPGDPRKGPTKKVPYIRDEDGTLLGDSGFIIEHLEKKHGHPLDGRLTNIERATGHLIRRTVEDSLYWATMFPRWCTDEGTAEMRKVFAPIMPPVIGGLVFNSIKGQTRKNAFAQGIARHTPANSYAIGKADVDALSAVLGDKPYLFGDEPTSYDACLYGTVANIIGFPIKNPLTDHARTLENLVAFRDRIETRYWKETTPPLTKSPPSPQPVATA